MGDELIEYLRISESGNHGYELQLDVLAESTNANLVLHPRVHQDRLIVLARYDLIVHCGQFVNFLHFLVAYHQSYPHFILIKEFIVVQ